MSLNKKNIIDYFQSGSKSHNECSIGIEHEKFLFYEKNNQRINYESILEIFKELYEFGWKPVYEGQNIIALNKGKKNITLEPGNQIELSGENLKNIHEACSESQNYLFELKQVTKRLNIQIVSSGFDPFSKLNEIPSNPKKRYSLMTKEMPKEGRLSLDMMYRSCGTQVNLDYVSENDFSKKFFVLNRIVPIIIALFANSSIIEKKKGKFLSYRSYVWQNTSRGGLPKIFLEKIDFEKYADYIINYPVLFIQKNESYFNPNGKTFKDFIEGKIEFKKTPSEKDLTNHLSTIFTETRLKKYIEFRSMDACGWDCLCAGPALLTGIIYSNLDEAYNIVRNWDSKDILSAYKDAPKKGFKTSLNKKDLYYWSSILINLGKKGLNNRNILNRNKSNEVKFLSHLENIILNKNTNAENILNKFSKDKNLSFLYEK
jgi:glutamate--cysteine ligase